MRSYLSSKTWLRNSAKVVLVLGIAGAGVLLGRFDWHRPASLLEQSASAAAVQDRPAAPELSGGTAWLNTAKPLPLEALRGRIVLLDFWTLCCINCMHILPDLAKLEAKYPGILVVIGVHTPKFPNEEKTDSIKKAILRYNIKHPVINDADRKIWTRYGVNSWPTFVLIDPDGNVWGRAGGEGLYDVLDRNIAKIVKEYRARKTLKETPLKFELVEEKDHGPLNFPGKVLADTASNRLFIADSSNNRIVVTDLSGKKIAVAGNGKQGFVDGRFDKAEFSDPQGMALDGDTLYVADRRNHSIRALDLKAERVKTVAGTGEQNGRNRVTGGAALKIGLNSPWDLLLHKRKIFIAMAGHHQIWTFDPAKERVDPFAGTGEENLFDAFLPNAAFAQPSGLATDGSNLFVADSETSSIRSLPINGIGQVRTIVGQGLFEFGDKEGTGAAVRLQHALGVAYRDGKLYVADTYNSKIKLLDPVQRSCSTYLGNGSTKTFNEPGGLSFGGDNLYVADTNNHRILVIDVGTKTVRTLTLSGVDAPAREKK